MSILSLFFSFLGGTCPVGRCPRGVVVQGVSVRGYLSGGVVVLEPYLHHAPSTTQTHRRNVTTGAYRQHIERHLPQPVVPDERLDVRKGFLDAAGHPGDVLQKQVAGGDALAGQEAAALPLAQLVHLVTAQVNPAGVRVSRQNLKRRETVSTK